MRRAIPVLASCLFAIPLATSGAAQALAVAHPLEDRQPLSCATHGFAKWPAELRHAASRYFVYALMSHNAYADRKSPRYQIDGWRPTVRRAYRSGLAFDVYRQEPSIGGGEIVVAYRGTASAVDWRANLALKEPEHYRKALEYLRDSVRAKHPGARVTVTGHSLGGGIALNMALRVPKVSAVVFNTSPRAFFGEESGRNRLIHVFEDGEILGVGNRGWLSLRLHDHDYTSFRYDYLGLIHYRPIAQHAMYPLSRGLLLTAVADRNPVARRIFAHNISPDAARKTDQWKQCRPLYEDA